MVYRGQDGQIDYDIPVAVMDLGDSQVAIADQELPANTIWHYVRRKVSECGLESPDSPVCVIRIDEAGQMQPLLPNRPLSVSVEALKGGKFVLRWRHSRIDEEVTPSEFRIYIDSGEGFGFFGKSNKPGRESLRFGTPVRGSSEPAAVVIYDAGILEYKWISDAYSHRQRCRFCVRSYSAAGGESMNTDYVTAVADSQGPDAINTVMFIDVEQLV